MKGNSMPKRGMVFAKSTKTMDTAKKTMTRKRKKLKAREDAE